MQFYLNFPNVPYSVINMYNKHNNYANYIKTENLSIYLQWQNVTLSKLKAVATKICNMTYFGIVRYGVIICRELSLQYHLFH